jgi:hypothetical protein
VRDTDQKLRRIVVRTRDEEVLVRSPRFVGALLHQHECFEANWGLFEVRVAAFLQFTEVLRSGEKSAVHPRPIMSELAQRCREWASFLAAGRLTPQTARFPLCNIALNIFSV